MDRLHELQSKAAFRSIVESEESSSKAKSHGKFSVNTSKVSQAIKTISPRQQEPSTVTLENNKCVSETNIAVSKTDANSVSNNGSYNICNNKDGNSSNLSSSSDEELIILIQQTMEEAENKLKELSAALAMPVIAESCSNLTTMDNVVNSSTVQETFSNTQLVLDKCATLIQCYDARKNVNIEESSTVTHMRERVSAHLHRKLNTLRQQLWIREDEWHRRRVENVARQLWLRFGHTSVGQANANIYLSHVESNTEGNDDAIEPVYSPPRGADSFCEDDLNVLAEALVYAERDDAIFSIPTSEIREAVERYNMVCNIEDKMRRLHHLFSELNWHVNAQDDDLHNIAQNVDATHVKVLNAREQLQRAKKYHSRCGCGCCCSMM